MTKQRTEPVEQRAWADVCWKCLGESKREPVTCNGFCLFCLVAGDALFASMAAGEGETCLMTGNEATVAFLV